VISTHAKLVFSTRKCTVGFVVVFVKLDVFVHTPSLNSVDAERDVKKNHPSTVKSSYANPVGIPVTRNPVFADPVHPGTERLVP
jgi:hypothetical protein